MSHEEPARLLRQLLLERFPSLAEVEHELTNPVPVARAWRYEPPAVKAAAVMTRLEQRLLEEQAALWRAKRFPPTTDVAS
jgi:hypothetical protein